MLLNRIILNKFNKFLSDRGFNVVWKLFRQDYSMDCYFRQSWRDSRLSFLGPIKSLSLSIKMLERIWRPDTYFYNGKHSYVHTITVPNKLLRISQDGDILYSMRFVRAWIYASNIANSSYIDILELSLHRCIWTIDR